MNKDEMRGKICNIVSRMLDNPGECGIYPTTKCYDEFEKLLQKVEEKCEHEWGHDVTPSGMLRCGNCGVKKPKRISIRERTNQ